MSKLNVMRFSMKDFIILINKRRANKFDVNMAVSGARGNGKSTFLFKLFSRMPGFDPWKHQIYTRKDATHLLESQKMGYIFDDEAIRSSYKRNFQNSEQKVFVQMLNMYRDNFNLYGMAIPMFYSLDKDLRGLIKIHVQIVKRGLGVIHIAKDSNLYSDDPWDVKYNAKIEERWAKKLLSNKGFNPPHHKLSTFFGYVEFGDLRKRQRNIYEEVKSVKRKIVYEAEMKENNKEEVNFYDVIIEKLLNGQMSKDMLTVLAQVNNKKYTAVSVMLNKKLAEMNKTERLSDLLVTPMEIKTSTRTRKSTTNTIVDGNSGFG